MADFIQLIPVVSAQNLDSISQPTFGNIESIGGGGVTSSILLTSDKTSIKVGETFTVKIQIKTNSLSISEYKVVITYDKSVLSVIDQDTTVPGTQIKLLDDVFTITDPAKNNTVSTTGVITLDAKTASGNAFQVNKDVAEIQFQAQSSGTPSVKITQGATGSQLIRSNGSSLTYTTNELTVQTTAQSVTPVPVTPVGNTPPPTTTPPAVTPPSTTTGSVTVIPATALHDDISQASGLFLGIFLIGTGIVIAKSKLFAPKKHSSPF